MARCSFHMAGLRVSGPVVFLAVVVAMLVAAITVRGLELDTAAGRVRRGGREVRLTRREYQLLEALALNEGRVLTRDVIQERVWMDEESYSNTVDVHVRAVRKKIDAGHDVKLIQSVYGLGYVLKGPEVDGDL